MPAPDAAADPDPLAGVATLCELFQRTTTAHADAPALRLVGEEQGLTWGEYGDRVRAVAGALAGLGVARGDAVALMVANRPEFHVVDTAAMHLGATPFSVYLTLPPDDVRHLFANAGNRVVVCEARFAERVQAAAEGTAVEHVVVLDGEAPGCLELAALEEPEDFDFDAAWRAVDGEDVLTLIYTSGTTGPSKGVELTHANVLAELRGVSAVLPLAPGDRTVSFLPHAHIADRWSSHYTPMVRGMQVTSVPDQAQLSQALVETRPTVWGAVPRVWEKLRAAIEAGAGGPVDPAQLGPEAAGALRARLGLDQARWIVVGAAPSPPGLLEWFAALGLPILELWGMSELSCCATINPPGAIRFGSVGTAIPGVEVRLADDGELLVRGGTVMRGYRGQPEATAGTLTEDGWLLTGDVATLDADGYVTIVDRKKELIINAAGKNMSPVKVEAQLKAAHPLIGQAVCVGDRRPYNVALLVLDPDAAAAWAVEQGRPDAGAAELAADPEVLELVGTAVAAANERLARVEQVKRWTLLGDEWLPGGDELTPTMKVKRRPIAEKHAAAIEALYA